MSTRSRELLTVVSRKVNLKKVKEHHFDSEVYNYSLLLFLDIQTKCVNQLAVVHSTFTRSLI